jgi:hypothetical protein
MGELTLPNSSGAKDHHRLSIVLVKAGVARNFQRKLRGSVGAEEVF